MPADCSATTIYPWWDRVPPHLATKTQLAQDGLKPAKGQRPCAGIGYGRGRRERYYDLYDRREAVPKKPPTSAQVAALEKAHLAQRTCRRCGAVKDRPAMLITTFDLRASRRCGQPDIYTGLGCCWDCENRAVAAQRALDRDEQILWARGLMARADWCVLDTETTDRFASVLEVSVVAPDGGALFTSLVRPSGLETVLAGEDGQKAALGCDEFPATHVHGIRPSDVAVAPSFADIEAALRTALTGKTVVVYNVEYDLNVLQAEIANLVPRKNGCLDWAGEQARVEEWLSATGDWQCAMLSYSAFRGAWSEYWGDYTYQPLGGGHRAEGDCREVLDLIACMAAAPLSTESQP